MGVRIRLCDSARMAGGLISMGGWSDKCVVCGKWYGHVGGNPKAAFADHVKSHVIASRKLAKQTALDAGRWRISVRIDTMSESISEPYEIVEHRKRIELPDGVAAYYEYYYEHGGTIQLDGHYTPLELRRIADWVDLQLRRVNPCMSTVPTPGVAVDADDDARAVVLGRLAGSE